jgi:hypothetical protein
MLTEISLPSIEAICYRMRERDKTEVYALRPHDNPYRLAWEVHAVILNQGRGRIAWHDGRPVALMAFTENWPGMWDAWMFGTDEFKSVAINLIRWGRREVVEILKTCNGHRCQCDSRADYDEAHRLLKALGARPEGPPMRRYGKDGADYQRFVWLRGQDDAILDLAKADAAA